jgi:uncharacterized DUF497 family protein
VESAGSGLVFDWDEENRSHIARHDVTPEEVEQVFENDPFDVEFEIVKGEERWTALGHTGRWRILMVVWTQRGDAIRPVTVLMPPKALRKMYIKRTAN